MTNEKQPMKTDKIMGILSLILGIILTLSFLGKISDIVGAVMTLLMALTGQIETYHIGRAFGYLLGAALIIFCIVKLFKYSSKTLGKSQEPTDEPPLE
jgi:hypothetical protein